MKRFAASMSLCLLLAGAAVAQTTQANAPWALDRLDQVSLPLDGKYSFPLYLTNAVHIYVVDSGISGTHVEFEGRAATVYSYYSDGFEDEENNDCSGHGTAVAGTIAAKTFGSGKNGSINMVRLTGCKFGQGAVTRTNLLPALRWLRANAVKPAVVNISVGISADPDVDQAVRNLIADGIVVVVSAGNEYGADAATKSPARVAEAITVAASTSTDRRSAESNVGPVIDLYAPGAYVETLARCPSYQCASDDPKSATYGDECLPPPPCAGITVESGTSFAAGYVTGAVAMILERNPTYTPKQVRDLLISRAEPKIVNPAANTTNLLLRVVTPAIPPDGPAY